MAMGFMGLIEMIEAAVVLTEHDMTSTGVFDTVDCRQNSCHARNKSFDKIVRQFTILIRTPA